MQVAPHLAVGAHPLAGDAGRKPVGAVRQLLVQRGVDLWRQSIRSKIHAYRRVFQQLSAAERAAAVTVVLYWKPKLPVRQYPINQLATILMLTFL